jgi:hypothetical protein
MQAYLMWVGVVVAFIFTAIPEWTTWVLLVAMALYDLFAVLTPHGPLQMLVNLAIERDQDIPALVYEAREVRRPRRRPTAPAESTANDNTVAAPVQATLAQGGDATEPRTLRAQAGPVAEANEASSLIRPSPAGLAAWCAAAASSAMNELLPATGEPWDRAHKRVRRAWRRSRFLRAAVAVGESSRGTELQERTVGEGRLVCILRQPAAQCFSNSESSYSACQSRLIYHDIIYDAFLLIIQERGLDVSMLTM